MSAPPEMLALVREWVEFAEADHVAGHRLLSTDESRVLPAVCFHAQQCAEKYIKALLVMRSIHFPKTHDLLELVGLLPPDLSVPLGGKEARELSDCAWTSRYPGPWEPITQWEAEEATRLADGVREAARAQLPPEVL